MSDYYLDDQEINLGDIVFLKKSKTKKIWLDDKWVKIFFPRGKYKIHSLGCYKNGRMTIGINPSLSPYASYSSTFDIDVAPVDLKFVKSMADLIIEREKKG